MPLSRREHQRPNGGFALEEDVAAFLQTLLEEICDIPRSLIVDTSRLGEDLLIESSQLAQVQVALEERYDIELDFLEVLRLASFSRIVAYIAQVARQEATRA